MMNAGRSTIILFASSRRHGNTGQLTDGFVICTSVYDTPCAPFIEAFRETFNYLGLRYGGCINANCKEGYKADRYAADIAAFTQLLHGS